MQTEVRVRRVQRPLRWFGWTNISRSGKHLNIVIATRILTRGRVRDVNPEEIRDTLMHEWAHAMRWVPEDHHNVTVHDASWGVHYASVYAAVVED